MRPGGGEQLRTGRIPHRGTDLVEDLVAWVLAAVGIVVALVAVFAASAAHAQSAERSRLESLTRTPVDAVTLEDSPMLTGAYSGSGVPVLARARWPLPHDGTRTGSVQVPTATPAGSRVQIWIDRNGDPVRAPLGESEAILVGVLSATGVLAAGGSVMAGAWTAVRRMTAARNLTRWEREWAQVGPVWTKQL
ncbi:hypothetical protein [Pseudonocardia sp. GCM10023141]|uniref:Rv1733c family protein n=1 Tax=Pseudonocardia sp. GCM10023141 TaxID=3252653 RepID=UPI0036209F79